MVRLHAMSLIMNIPQNNKWINRIFEAKIAKSGGIVRRKSASVEKFASVKALKAEVKSKRFHMLLVGDQYVIICSTGNLKVIC